MSSPESVNIWIAAGDGDLEVVRRCVEHEGMDPNAPDANTYTAMHAAASYGHIHVLSYLVSRGGNVNVRDQDGDTPLYVVETLEMAKFLVESGADCHCTNLDGLTAAEHLLEEYPDISGYLLSVSSTQRNPHSAMARTQDRAPMSLADDVQAIMGRAEAEGRDDVEDELRAAVIARLGEVMDVDESALGGDSNTEHAM